MKIALCGTDALKCWRDVGFCAGHRSERLPLPDGFVPSIEVAEALYLSQKYGIQLPVCSIVSEAKFRKRGEVLATRVMRGASDRSLFIRMGKTSYCASPELTLLQVADDLAHRGFEGDRPVLVRDSFRTKTLAEHAPSLLTALFASEFMSNYALRCDSPDGFVGRSPLMGIKELDSFIEGSSGYGTVTLREARKAVFENANSPMETSLSLLLSQQVRFGGLGMGVPRVNYEVTTLHRGKAKTRFIDLCYPEAMLAIEVNSKRYHSGERSAADDERRNEITALGYCLVVITPEILFDAALLHETMAPFRRRMGLGRVFPSDYAQRRADLRELVFEANNTLCAENRHRMLGPQLSVG